MCAQVCVCVRARAHGTRCHEGVVSRYWQRCFPFTYATTDDNPLGFQCFFAPPRGTNVSGSPELCCETIPERSYIAPAAQTAPARKGLIPCEAFFLRLWTLFQEGGRHVHSVDVFLFPPFPFPSLPLIDVSEDGVGWWWWWWWLCVCVCVCVWGGGGLL